MNRTNLILLSFNLLLLGIMLGAGIVAAPRLLQGQCGLHEAFKDGPGGPQGMPRRKMLGEQFGPAFQQSLTARLDAATPDWAGKLKAARAALQQAIAAEPFDADAFKAASAVFDKLLDDFHATMRDEIHTHILQAPAEERRGIAKSLSQMPLPLVDDPHAGPGRDSDSGSYGGPEGRPIPDDHRGPPPVE